MTEKEKVLAGIKCCLSDHDCIGCPYDDVDSSCDECTFSDITKTKVRFGGYELPLERDRWFKGTVADALKDAGVGRW